jgi:hypothetical protein
MNFGKQTSSRITVSQPLTWAGTGSVTSASFSSQTYQIRVISQINGWIGIDNTGTSVTTGTNAGGTFIAANTANGDYFSVTPGQKLQFTSSTTGTTGIIISLAEMS